MQPPKRSSAVIGTIVFRKKELVLTGCPGRLRTARRGGVALIVAKCLMPRRLSKTLASGPESDSAPYRLRDLEALRSSTKEQ